MFDRLKKAFSKDAPSLFGNAAAVPQADLAEWANSLGYALAVSDSGRLRSLTGKVMERPWRLDIGPSTRSFIRGDEIRARAEAGINEDVAVLVMNRPLKVALEKQAYALYTDSLQTTADPSLPEEMRWLAMYEEFGWDALPRNFWDRYSVMGDQRETAIALVTQELADMMMDWPEDAHSAEVPFLLMLLRGKVYLRMEYSPSALSTLQHGTKVFLGACESAIGGLSTDIAL
jgi:hypothetical protein